MTALKTAADSGIVKKAFFALVLLLTMVLSARSSVSDDFTDRRITTGTKIFKALLAADSDIAAKKAADGDLAVYLLYVDDTRNARRTADILESRESSGIHKITVRVEIVTVSRFLQPGTGRAAGVFLTQPLNDERLQMVINRAVREHVIVFSPFEGDVERGVQGGIAVEAQVRPYLNMKALQAARIQLKSFFLRVSKQL